MLQLVTGGIYLCCRARERIPQFHNRAERHVDRIQDQETAVSTRNLLRVFLHLLHSATRPSWNARLSKPQCAGHSLYTYPTSIVSSRLSSHTPSSAIMNLPYKYSPCTTYPSHHSSTASHHGHRRYSQPLLAPHEPLHTLVRRRSERSHRAKPFGVDTSPLDNTA
jgi:hypothetical protein